MSRRVTPFAFLQLASNSFPTIALCPVRVWGVSEERGRWCGRWRQTTGCSNLGVCIAACGIKLSMTDSHLASTNGWKRDLKLLCQVTLIRLSVSLSLSTRSSFANTELEIVVRFKCHWHRSFSFRSVTPNSTIHSIDANISVVTSHITLTPVHVYLQTNFNLCGSHIVVYTNSFFVAIPYAHINCVE